MAKIFFTGTSRRAVLNWLPALEALRARGHNVCSILFPHRPDPDSAALSDLSFECMATVPIIEHLSVLDQNISSELAGRAADIIRAHRPDMLLLTTCHAGPETLLMQLLAADAERPVIVGCQHGFVQLWHAYWYNPCFDYLFVFGDLFLDLAPEHIRPQIVVAGLPKLDAIHPGPARDFVLDRRPILFAAQTNCTPRLADALLRLKVAAGRDILIRPHPEFRDAFQELGLPFADVDELIILQFQRVSMVLTTGSTVALEALGAEVPVVVLPEQRGDFYKTAGIVAQTMEAPEILDIALRQAQPERRGELNRFLQFASGSCRADRTTRTAGAIEAVLSSVVEMPQPKSGG